MRRGWVPNETSFGDHNGKHTEWRMENGDLIPGLPISNFQSPLSNLHSIAQTPDVLTPHPRSEHLPLGVVL